MNKLVVFAFALVCCIALTLAIEIPEEERAATRSAFYANHKFFKNLIEQAQNNAEAQNNVRNAVRRKSKAPIPAGGSVLKTLDQVQEIPEQMQMVPTLASDLSLDEFFHNNETF